MKILFVMTKSEAGGAQTHVYQMARALRERGHEVCIMSQPDGWLQRVACAEKIEFHANPYLSNRINIIRDIRAGIRLARTVRAFKPDLVSCHNSKAGIIGRLTIRRKVPTLFTVHGWGFAERGRLMTQLVFIPCEKLAARYTDKLICVSHYLYVVARELNIAPEHKLTVIHNGVESTRDNPSQTARDKTLRILFIGRLVSQKDPETLLHAYASLPDSLRSRTQLRIIGEGEKRPALQTMIQNKHLSDRVHLLGSLDRAEVLAELQRGDIFVLTTHYEGLPRTALEAMHAGLPVIVSDVSGNRELFDADGEGDPAIGMLVAENSVPEVQAALERLTSNAGLRVAMGRSARARARRLFSLDRMVEDTLAVYEEVTGAGEFRMNSV